MQYLLSEEEYKALVSRMEVARRDSALAAAKRLILKLGKFECKHFCRDCPIGGYVRAIGYELDYDHANLICRDPNKNYPK